jgi:putative FmdB family regulatory protein
LKPDAGLLARLAAMLEVGEERPYLSAGSDCARPMPPESPPYNSETCAIPSCARPPEPPMPIYAYKCSSCGHAQDVLQKISDDPLTVCPACQAATFAKQVTAAGFQLKGSGWYVTDFRDGNKKADKKPDAKPDATPAAGTTAGDSKPDAKVESKPETKTEAKAESKTDSKAAAASSGS